MIEAIQTECTISDGKIILRFLATDQMKYEIALPPENAAQTVATLLLAASDLPGNDSRTVHAPRVKAGLQLVVGPDFETALLLSFGPLEFALPLTEAQLASLSGDIAQLVANKSSH